MSDDPVPAGDDVGEWVHGTAKLQNSKRKRVRRVARPEIECAIMLVIHQTCAQQVLHFSQQQLECLVGYLSLSGCGGSHSIVYMRIPRVLGAKQQHSKRAKAT